MGFNTFLTKFKDEIFFLIKFKLRQTASEPTYSFTDKYNNAPEAQILLLLNTY